MPGDDPPERHPRTGQLLARGLYPRDRIVHGPGPFERRRHLQLGEFVAAEQPARHFQPERHLLDDSVALEFEVDVGELPVDVHADRHPPGQQCAERRPRLLLPRRASCTSRAIADRDALLPRPRPDRGGGEVHLRRGFLGRCWLIGRRVRQSG
ncbi:hypothetical protein ACFWQK_16470 [Brachybacterium paraconglomeratum]